MSKTVVIIVNIFILVCCFQQTEAGEKKQKTFRPGLEWLDTNGKPINAHGGGVIFYKGKYYWYGEHKIEGKSENEFADGGIHCYSSRDLINWKDEGVVLSVDYQNDKSDIAYGCILERVKVVYNEKTKKFIAYFKLYLKGVGYETSNVGIALADRPNGPFTYSHKFLGGGSAKGSGDFCMFKDHDGSLYHFTVRKPDKTFVIGKLQDNYLYNIPDSYNVPMGIEAHTEAPAVLCRNGKYFLFGSGSTGWKPNPARSFVADSINGIYQNIGNPTKGINPITGSGPEISFGGQISCVIKVEGKKDAYIAMFDVWEPEMPIKGKYIWLPLIFKNDVPVIEWRNSWDLSFFDSKLNHRHLKSNKNSFVDPQSPKGSRPYLVNDSVKIHWKLVFSDEFNDNKIDTLKWTIENSKKKRPDITLLSNNDQVEEKNGNAYIYYRKSNLNDSSYLVGRFNSKEKFATTYGYFECRMHVVKPDGYQTAFWMMPKNGSTEPEGIHDGTANDGAEIDIVEACKQSDTYSTGLHWDGYGSAHKSKGKIVNAPGLHSQEYHIWGFEWTPTYLRYYYDGKPVRTISDPKLIPHVPHFMHLTGSCWGKSDWVEMDIRDNKFIQSGNTDKAYIDYIRVYQQEY